MINGVKWNHSWIRCLNNIWNVTHIKITYGQIKTVYLFAVHTAYRLAGFANRKHIERANLRVSSFHEFSFCFESLSCFHPCPVGDFRFFRQRERGRLEPSIGKYSDCDSGLSFWKLVRFCNMLQCCRQLVCWQAVAGCCFVRALACWEITHFRSSEVMLPDGLASGRPRTRSASLHGSRASSAQGPQRHFIAFDCSSFGSIGGAPCSASRISGCRRTP